MLIAAIIWTAHPHSMLAILATLVMVLASRVSDCKYRCREQVNVTYNQRPKRESISILVLKKYMTSNKVLLILLQRAPCLRFAQRRLPDVGAIAAHSAIVRPIDIRKGAQNVQPQNIATDPPFGIPKGKPALI